jgi:hypothetical protein
MVVHVYNPSYLGGRDRSILVLDWPGEKCETPSRNKLKAKGLGA